MIVHTLQLREPTSHTSLSFICRRFRSAMIQAKGAPACAASCEDKTSLSNFTKVSVEHLSINLELHFNEKYMSGYADVSAIVKEQGTRSLKLDTRNMKVHKVTFLKCLCTSGGCKGMNVEDAMEFSMSKEHPAFGAALAIQLPWEMRSSGTKFTVRIEYETAKGDDCSAVQWLSPEQTAGKKHPYLFSQCQAIHARSMVPCQDTPAVKSPYDANITVPGELTALMSAVPTSDDWKDSSKSSKIFSFVQKVPIPSYLIALAAGCLVSRDIGPRSRVWSEPSMVEAGAYEFAETEQFLKTAEDICGPYVWGRYDILLLPPSFPYGGMENPCLTFVTPTLLAGDRSLANVVAHEIAHSWMGNLVTNMTWEHFWMNEGFTVFVERKIVTRMFGEKEGTLHSKSGWNSLCSSVNNYGCHHEFTQLHIPLDDVDPDDAFSSIPYEKGYIFLYYLQELVGGPTIFEPFIKAHCTKYAYSHVECYSWKLFFLDYFKKAGIKDDVLNQIDWYTWFEQPGMPPYTPKFDESIIEGIKSIASTWISSDDGSSKVTEKDLSLKSSFPKSTSERVVFLEYFHEKHKEKKITQGLLQRLDSVYSLTSSTNAEVQFLWYKLAIKTGYSAAFDATIKFLTSVGRMKFVRPLYKELRDGGSETNALGKSTFIKYRSIYHSIAQKMVAKDLGLSSDSLSPVVGIIMGSDSDLPKMKAAAEVLDEFKVPYEITIVSAHRTPQRMYEYASEAAGRKLKVIIAGAGGAAHLPGMVAAITSLPVIGVPVKSSALSGNDSLLSIVQMPRGVPVATVAIDNSANAALLAIRILGTHDDALAAKVIAHQKSEKDSVEAKAKKLEGDGYEKYLSEMK